MLEPPSHASNMNFSPCCSTLPLTPPPPTRPLHHRILNMTNIRYGATVAEGRVERAAREALLPSLVRECLPVGTLPLLRGEKELQRRKPGVPSPCNRDVFIRCLPSKQNIFYILIITPQMGQPLVAVLCLPKAIIYSLRTLVPINSTVCAMSHDSMVGISGLKFIWSTLKILRDRIESNSILRALSAFCA